MGGYQQGVKVLTREHTGWEMGSHQSIPNSMLALPIVIQANDVHCVVDLESQSRNIIKI